MFPIERATISQIPNTIVNKRKTGIREMIAETATIVEEEEMGMDMAIKATIKSVINNK